MTGENFKRINRKNTTVKRLKAELGNVKEQLSNYIKSEHKKYINDIEEDRNYFNICNNFERRINRLEWLLYCAEYEDNRRRNWK